MKSKLSLLLGAAVLMSSPGAAGAAAEQAAGGAAIQQESAATQLVPLRKVFTDLGATVDWDKETFSAIIEWEDQDMSIIVDVQEKVALYNGKQFFFDEGAIDRKPGIVYVSAQFIESVAHGKLVETAGVFSIIKEEATQ